MFKDFYRKYLSGNIVSKFIFANVLLYVFLLLIGVFSMLFNIPGVANTVLSFLEFPASFVQFVSRPWTLFTYMFVHAGVWHLLWNMMALYLFGRIFLNFYSERQFVGTYIIGGLSGAVLYAVAYNTFPYFAPIVGVSRLVGASAALMAIVVAAAVRSPQYRINLFLIGSVRLSTLAVAVVIISFLMLSGDNAGGNFAHLGGAFAGWLIAYLLNKGVDVVSFFLKPWEWFVSLFKRTRAPRRTRFNYVRGGRNADYEYNARRRAENAEVDRILEKIKQGGYASLSEEEKRILFEASSR